MVLGAKVKYLKKSVIPELQRKILSGEIFNKKSNKFSYYFNIFLKHKEEHIKAFTTRLPYYNRVNHKFGDYDIDNITRFELKEYLFNLDMKNTSKGVYRSCLKEIFDYALDDNIISVNPILNFSFKKSENIEVQFFTKDEVNILLKKSTGIIHIYLHIAFNTGLRPEEILGLKFSDINNNIITIQRVRTKFRIDTPKTKNSYRKIHISDFVLKKINELNKYNEFLFFNLDDSSRLRYQYKKLLNDTNIKHRKLSSTRHTYATLMLKNKLVSLNELSGLLGHSSPRVTLTYYASVIKAEEVNLGIDFNLYDSSRIIT